jgi:hypothetical protein
VLRGGFLAFDGVKCPGPARLRFRVVVFVLSLVYAIWREWRPKLEHELSLRQRSTCAHAYWCVHEILQEELEKVWENLGYTFLSTTQVHTAYHMPAGVKLYTEQYDAIFSTAVKGAKK